MTTRPDGELDAMLWPTRNSVLFPGEVTSLDVGRPPSIALIDDITARRVTQVAVICQRDPACEAPRASDLHRVGTLVKLLDVDKLGPDNYSVLVQGLERFEIVEVHQGERLRARGRTHAAEGQRIVDDPDAVRVRELARAQIPSTDAALLDEDDRNERRMHAALDAATTVGPLTDLVAAMLVDHDVDLRQPLLEMFDPAARAARLAELLDAEATRRADLHARLDQELRVVAPLVAEALANVERTLGCARSSAFALVSDAVDAAIASSRGDAPAVVERILEDLRARVQLAIPSNEPYEAMARYNAYMQIRHALWMSYEVPDDN